MAGRYAAGALGAAGADAGGPERALLAVAVLLALVGAAVAALYVEAPAPALVPEAAALLAAGRARKGGDAPEAEARDERTYSEPSERT